MAKYRPTPPPVLAPVVGARTRLVMAEVVPSVSIGAVVLPHGSPLALGEVGSPLAPGNGVLACFTDAAELGDRADNAGDRADNAPSVHSPHLTTPPSRRRSMRV